MSELKIYTRTELEQQMAGAGRIELERGYFSETKNAISISALLCVWTGIAGMAVAVLFRNNAVVMLPGAIVLVLSALQIQSLAKRGLASQKIIVKPKHTGRSWIIPLLVAFQIGMAYHMLFEFLPSNWELLSMPLTCAAATTAYRFLGLQK